MVSPIMQKGAPESQTLEDPSSNHPNRGDLPMLLYLADAPAILPYMVIPAGGALILVSVGKHLL